ncbi:MAG: hypothetical protein EON91_13405 [Brevundimonas sp.]|uniref:hypothetical protein n=1 Tax=Brevundimonas sp. TaxID=1871086 RepID=UPI0011F54238|nr:hypothetical protein [Brevundimonas sp.]RZJ16415.1 MAG: hypothetical protein EON91_13405 [Brevundimonas sp.]
MNTRDRLTPLERAVLDALVWDLRDVTPDLGGQVEEALPGLRRNTGQGAVTELIVARDRPVLTTGPTGRFGTVHAMVGDLADAVAFQVELRHGRLMALHADSYGQDTRRIDFATAPFEDVFLVDSAGASILYEPARHMPESPLFALQKSDEPPLPDHGYYDQHTPDDLAAADQRTFKAVQRIFGGTAYTAPGATPTSTPFLRVSPGLRRTIAVAYWTMAVLFGLAWIGAWEPVRAFWGWFGIDNAVPWIIFPFFLIGFIYKLTNAPKPARQP